MTCQSRGENGGETYLFRACVLGFSRGNPVGANMDYVKREQLRLEQKRDLSILVANPTMAAPIEEYFVARVGRVAELLGDSEAEPH